MLLKNDPALPLTRDAPAWRCRPRTDGRPAAVQPGGERSRGFADRNRISPLDALTRLAPPGSKINYSAGIDRVGTVVPASAAPAVWTGHRTVRAPVPTRPSTSGGANPLTPGVAYTWTGTVTCRPPTRTPCGCSAHQASSTPPAASTRPGAAADASGAVSLQVDGTAQSLTSPSTILANTYPGGPTIAGQYQGLPNSGATCR